MSCSVIIIGYLLIMAEDDCKKRMKIAVFGRLAKTAIMESRE
jgi:hypothetical protein